MTYIYDFYYLEVALAKSRKTLKMKAYVAE